MAVSSTENSGITNFARHNSNRKPALAGLLVEYLIIAGGAGGGGGGGGAGGYKSSVAGELSGRNSPVESPVRPVNGETYTVIVGAGGGGGTNGQDSSFGQISALGGGAGRGYGGNAGLNGGSGGGGGGPGGITTGNGAGGLGASGQGHDGGPGRHQNQSYFLGGGGGGAGGTGGTYKWGGADSGVGIASSITGSSVTRAVGGRGSNASNANGGANTGNGGSASGSGGSGVVILRHPAAYGVADTTGSPNITTTGAYRVYEFNGSGTIGW